MATEKPEEGPSTYALRLLVRLRWAEALLAARAAEDVIAEYASYEAQVISNEERSSIWDSTY